MKYGRILVLAFIEEALASERLREESRENLLMMREWIENSPYESEFVNLSLDEYRLIRYWM